MPRAVFDANAGPLIGCSARLSAVVSRQDCLSEEAGTYVVSLPRSKDACRRNEEPAGGTEMLRSVVPLYHKYPLLAL